MEVFGVQWGNPVTIGKRLIEALDMSLPSIMAFVILVWAITGLYFLASCFLNVLHFIWARFLRPGKNLKKSYGEWAVVTGATDGIGAAMAMEFAQKGLNVVLLSRTLANLEKTKVEIEGKTRGTVAVKIMAVDFTNFDEKARAKVTELLADLPVGVLVNNVGVSYPFTKYFHELLDSEVEDLITVNCESTTWMTRIVLPGMLARKKGAIVNMASAAGVTTSPLLAQYGAAKSYVAMFSRALHYELAPLGIHVQCQVPLFVATKLAKIRHASLTVASPKGYAKAAVANIGFGVVVSPFWAHTIQLYVLSLLPEWLGAYITGGMHHNIRKAGMKKAASSKSS